MRAPQQALTAVVLLLALGSASAEVVEVKYAGAVNLSGMKCENTVSSFVNRVCFRPRDEYLVVLLGDTYYQYCRVPAGVVSSWLGSASLGRFFNTNVKGKAAYDCRLVGGN